MSFKTSSWSPIVSTSKRLTLLDGWDMRDGQGGRASGETGQTLCRRCAITLKKGPNKGPNKIFFRTCSIFFSDFEISIFPEKFRFSIESDSKNSFSRSRCIGSEPGIRPGLFGNYGLSCFRMLVILFQTVLTELKKFLLASIGWCRDSRLRP